MTSIQSPRSLAMALVAASFGSIAMAQTSPAPAKNAPTNEEPVQLSTLIVTGSNIAVAADRAAVPVTIVSSKDIAETGTSANLLEVLRKRMPELAGRTNVGNSSTNTFNQNTAGGSQISIRNLDTLVLLNGRRMAPSGANGFSTGRSFVDVSHIPVAAIERVEILTDGSSAIYGSDAIGGVVNIILKNDYQGAEIGGRYGAAKGGYDERSGYVVAGAGKNGINLSVTGSWSKTTPLFGNNRPFDFPLLGKTAALPGVIGANGANPGAILRSSLTSPSQSNPVGTSATATSVSQLLANGTYVAGNTASIAGGFDSSPFQTILLGQEQRGAVGNGSAEIFGKKLVLFGDFMLSDVKSFDRFLPVNATVTEPTGAPYNPLTIAFPQVSFAVLANPRQATYDARGQRGMIGLKGEITDNWKWETGYVYDQNKINQQQHNVIYAPNLTRAIAGGYDSQGNAVAGGGYSRVITGFSESSTTFAVQPALDPFSTAPSPASLANVLGTESLNTSITLQTYDLKLVGMPFDLPGGRFGMAIGGNFRREVLRSHADENGFNTGPTNHRWTGGVYLDPFSQSRKVDASFAEIRAPITGPTWNFPGVNALDLSLAEREERYSDAGKSTVPKVGVRWQPIDDQVVGRFTYSKAFTAPTLFAMFGPKSTGLTATSVLTQVFGVAGQVNQLNGNNPNLKPSLAWSRSFGVAISPHAVKHLTLTADFVDTFQKGFPGGVGATNILNSVEKYGPASPFVGQFAFNNFPGQPGAAPVTGAGQLSSYLKGGGSASQMFIEDHFVNLGGIHVEAIDLSADYEVSHPVWGRFDFSSAAAIISSYQFQALPDQPFYQYAGYATYVGSGNQGTLPRYRLYSTVDWTHGSWSVLLANTFIPAVTDIAGGGATFFTSTTLKPMPVDHYFAWDAHVSYTVTKKAAAEIWQHLRGLTLTVGVNNAFDRMPPQSPQAFTDANVDAGTYSPLGRLWFASATVKF